MNKSGLENPQKHVANFQKLTFLEWTHKLKNS